MAQVFKPHDYQEVALQHLLDLPRAGLWMPMGGGKSVTTLTALEHLAVVENVYPALVLAPLRVAKTTWPDEIAKWEHTKHLRVVPIVGTAKERLNALKTPADIYTSNYDNLVWLVETLGDKWPFNTVIADECFVAGTQVSTPSGPVAIETLNEGDLVDTHVGPRPITHVYHRLAKTLNLVCLTLSTGVKIYATKTHPFFTDAGWLPAGDCAGRQVYSKNCLSDLSNRLYAKQRKGTYTGGFEQTSVLLPELPIQGSIGSAGASSKVSAIDAET